MCHNNGVRGLGIRGFSLIEVTIAITVLITAMAGFMMLIQNTNRNVQTVEQRSDVTSAFDLIKLYLLNSEGCTKTFVTSNSLKSTRYGSVLGNDGRTMIAQGAILDTIGRLSFDGIDLLGVNTAANKSQDVTANIIFKVKDKTNGQTVFREEIRNMPLHFSYNAKTDKLTCQTAQEEAFIGAVEASCKAVGGTYDPSATTAASCTLPKDTALADRVACLEYCELNSANQTAKATYSAQVNNKACSCMGTDPCMCLHTETYYAFDPKRDDTCGVNRCVGTKGCVAECDDFLVPKGQTYQDSICKTTTCYGTCVDNRTCSGTENGYAAGTTYEIGCYGSRQTCQGKGCADNKYMYKFVKEETTSHANEATPVYVASKKCTYARYCYYDSKRTALDLITQVGFWDLCTVCNFDMGLCRYYDNKTKQYVNGGVTSASTGLGDMSCPSGQEYTDVSETAVKSLITSGLFCSGSGCISSCSGIGVRPIYFSW